MGLYISHNCWHGRYSSFGEFRRLIAVAAGIPLDLMEGHYNGACECDSISSKWIKRFLPISWEILKDDAVLKLLHHSDCDGIIASVDCKPLADRLEELLPKIDGQGWMIRCTKQFIDGLRAAAEANEDVEFG